ncbi:hypothetical protein NGRA_0081 [Nosema granulosis]|uniref:Uncharacterized protein n=1 Tax=Nosema granulosis TaxID=83296 RepID=A0A9P6H208_9MICR|nr:hypothetical protein NGRA_0081 [Nosema granulosis]
MKKNTKENPKEQLNKLELQIRSVFLKGEEASDEQKLVLIKKYLKNKPKYLNEIKIFLREKDEELYRQYAECFITNPGVEEAFGIKGESVEKVEIKRVKSLKPVLHSTGERKQDDRKKRIARRNKKEVRERYKEKEEKKKEYEKKLSKIHEKIKKKN